MTHDPKQPDASVAEPQQEQYEDDPEVTEAAATANQTGTDLAAIRELVLRAHPDVVPELIAGETIDDLLVSIEPAQAAFRRISESLRAVAPPPPPDTPRVPAGGDRPMPVDPDRLPASEKIRRGLARQ